MDLPVGTAVDVCTTDELCTAHGVEVDTSHVRHRPRLAGDDEFVERAVISQVVRQSA